MRYTYHRPIWICSLVLATSILFAHRNKEPSPPPPVLHNIDEIRLEISAPDELVGVADNVESALRQKLTRAGMNISTIYDSELPVFRIEILALAHDGHFFYSLTAQLSHRSNYAIAGGVPLPIILWDAPPMIGMMGDDQFDILISRSLHAADQFLKSWRYDKKQNKGTTSNYRLNQSAGSGTRLAGAIRPPSHGRWLA